MAAAASPLGSFSENATRLGMRIQETLTERITRDFGSSTTALFDTEDKTTDIRKRLDSTNDKEKIDALRRLIAMISKGRNVSEFFAQVVKNVASHNLEVRKLVYIYILRYAESEPDLALLSVNTFQRDLTDSNPLIRSMALRVLSGIRVAVIGSIVTLAIKKCSADVSPYVRKTAALAIPKCLSLDDGQRRELMTILVNFLNERSPLTIGTVLVAFNSVCPDRLDLLHPHYRRLCRLLPDADEWGQITIVNVLVRYARRMLPKPLVFQDHNGATVERIDSDLQLLFRSAESLFFSRNPAVVLAVSRALYYLGPPSDTPKIVPPLLKLLRTSTEIERVVVEELYIIARASPELLSSHYNRLFLRSSDLPSTKLAKLRILVKLMKSENASALLGEFTEYVHDRDDSVAAAAVDAIGTCARLLPEYTSRCIEILIRLMKDGIDAVGSSAVRVLKDLVQSNRRETFPAAAAAAATVVVAVEGIASVQTPAEIVASLAHQFDDVRHPRAKACVLWLVGQYAAAATSTTATTATTATAKDGVQIQVVPGVENWAPDVLRRAVKSFAHDDKAVKLQTLTLTAKLLSLSPESEILGKLSMYCFSLARYDQSYDVRDRGRLLSTLLADICPKLKTVSSTGNNNQNSIQEQEQEQEWNEGTTDDDGGGGGGGGLGRGMITLRKEQIQMILFQGKEPSEEEPDPVDPTMTLGSMALVT
ncbi:AP-3 complex subunit beta, partial [Serendipita sp. 405]